MSEPWTTQDAMTASLKYLNPTNGAVKPLTSNNSGALTQVYFLSGKPLDDYLPPILLITHYRHRDPSGAAGVRLSPEHAGPVFGHLQQERPGGHLHKGGAQ